MIGGSAIKDYNFKLIERLEVGVITMPTSFFLNLQLIFQSESKKYILKESAVLAL